MILPDPVLPPDRVMPFIITAGSWVRFPSGQGHRIGLVVDMPSRHDGERAYVEVGGRCYLPERDTLQLVAVQAEVLAMIDKLAAEQLARGRS